MKKTCISNAAFSFSLCFILGTISAFAAAGSLDQTFGTNGLVQANLCGKFQFTGAVLASKGNIVVAGMIPNSAESPSRKQLHCQ